MPRLAPAIRRVSPRLWSRPAVETNGRPAARRWLSSGDLAMLKTSRHVFSRRDTGLSPLLHLLSFEDEVSKSKDPPPEAGPLLQAASRQDEDVSLKDLVHEIVGDNIDRQTALQVHCRRAAGQSWFGSGMGVASAHTILAWLAEWQGEVSAAAEHAHEGFKALALDLGPRSTPEGLEYHRDLAAAMRLNVNPDDEVETDLHEIFLADAGAHMAHALLLQVIDQAPVPQPVASAAARRSSPPSPPSSPPSGSTSTPGVNDEQQLLDLLCGRAHLDLSSPSRTPSVNSHSSVASWAEEQVAPLSNLLLRALLLLGSLTKHPMECRAQYLQAQLDFALAAALLGSPRTFVHAAAQALFVARELDDNHALSPALRIASCQIGHVLLAWTAEQMDPGTARSGPMTETLLDLAHWTALAHSQSLVTWNQILFLDHGRFAVPPSKLLANRVRLLSLASQRPFAAAPHVDLDSQDMQVLELGLQVWPTFHESRISRWGLTPDNALHFPRVSPRAKMEVEASFRPLVAPLPRTSTRQGATSPAKPLARSSCAFEQGEAWFWLALVASGRHHLRGCLQAVADRLALYGPCLPAVQEARALAVAVTQGQTASTGGSSGSSNLPVASPVHLPNVLKRRRHVDLPLLQEACDAAHATAFTSRNLIHRQKLDLQLLEYATLLDVSPTVLVNLWMLHLYVQHHLYPLLHDPKAIPPVVRAHNEAVFQAMFTMTMQVLTAGGQVSLKDLLYGDSMGFSVEQAQLVCWFYENNGAVLPRLNSNDQTLSSQRDLVLHGLKLFRGAVLEAQANSATREALSWLFGRR
ncbi:uncharacterized protein MONBRDRAFT_36302 [Monosiga brevicollis MX1]|uniref:Uncharacterized protein n=1 Tax=Monosiga brevicollis TaxID=81824 RepID=A9UUS2_MONBE|nr:uncharacterized protein MONBRDRAFT_36302 [Monosiga brevicollis MX1]EDQ90955.1 predicted protein [Monosiga brevicollis MX1]|eukprot:XP_001744252.1 hypothetical protein [Monosiga brevicollis MX1]